MPLSRNQAGFTSIVVILSIIAIIGSVFIVSRAIQNKPQTTQSLPPPQIASPSATEPTPAAPLTIPKSQVSTSSKPTLKPSPSKLPSPTPSLQPSSPQSNVPIKKSTCDINIINGRLGGTSDDPLLITLVYAYNPVNNASMTGAQWDFDGNGSWDTDMKQSNGTIEHTFGSGGNFNIKLKVQGSDGSVTDTCSKNVSVSPGITVKVTGQVYDDINCNNFHEPSEKGVAGTPVRLYSSPDYQIVTESNSDGSGNFTLSKSIRQNESLNVVATNGPVPEGYKSNPKFNGPTYSLSASQSSMNIDIPIVSIANVGSCSL